MSPHVHVLLYGTPTFPSTAADCERRHDYTTVKPLWKNTSEPQSSHTQECEEFPLYAIDPMHATTSPGATNGSSIMGMANLQRGILVISRPIEVERLYRW